MYLAIYKVQKPSMMKPFIVGLPLTLPKCEILYSNQQPYICHLTVFSDININQQFKMYFC